MSQQITAKTREANERHLTKVIGEMQIKNDFIPIRLTKFFISTGVGTVVGKW